MSSFAFSNMKLSELSWYDKISRLDKSAVMCMTTSSDILKSLTPVVGQP